MNRSELAAKTELVGKAVNELRMSLLSDSNTIQAAPFAAGIVRAAEEAILVVYNRLNDSSVPESEL